MGMAHSVKWETVLDIHDDEYPSLTAVTGMSFRNWYPIFF